MNETCIIAERKYSLIMMSIQISSNKIKHSQIHEIKYHFRLIQLLGEYDFFAVGFVVFPVGFLFLVVAATVRVSCGVPFDEGLFG